MSKKGINIHKRKDGRWEGRYKVGVLPSGYAKYASVYRKTFTEAKEKLYAAIALGPTNRSLARDRTFSEVLHIWMENNRLRQKGATELKYRSLIKSHIEPALGALRVSDITAPTINNFLATQMERGRIGKKGELSSSYVRTMAQIIQSVMHFAAREEYCSPLKTDIFMPAQKKKEMQILTREEEKTLEKYCFTHLEPTTLGILVTMYAGLRIGEICALSWEDIDLVEGVIHIRHTVARVRNTNPALAATSTLILDSPKTASSIRKIPIVSVLGKVLDEQKRAATTEYVVSRNRDFLSPKTYDYRYRRILDACGLRQINYHALRHTFATRCAEAGVDVKSLSEILGHADVGITLNTYVHSSMERKRAQLELVVLSGSQ